MTGLPKLVEQDRGLGTAYERYCFYERMEAWRTQYGIETMLEGPVDGMAGIHGVHGVGMARKGVKVTSALVTEDEAAIAREVYARKAGGAEGSVASFEVRGGVAPTVAAIESLPMADLVLCYHALPFVDDWQTYARAMASRARKLFVVAICNPDNWGVSAVKLLALARGNNVSPPDVWHTRTLAPVLWSLGRVREHVYFDCPWWPDMPVAAGQSVSDRLKQLAFGKRKDVGLQAPVTAKLADKFVYGPDKWPYFGEDPAWNAELLPALLRHPGFDGGTSKWLAKVAHLHAFVVDVEPRTPQARRRLHLQEAAPT